MRYAVFSDKASFADIRALCQRCGAQGAQEAPRLGQLFVDLSPDQVKWLEGQGLRVKPLGKVGHTQVPAVAGAPIYAASQTSLASFFYQFRDTFDPPLLGEGWTVAVLDSGIRRTHMGLAGKVAYEANFSGSPTCDDVFSHGTGVAYMLAGGQHAPGREGGIAPGITLWNIKVLDDAGEGTVEAVILGLEHVIAKHEEAEAAGLPFEDPMYPQAVNLSLGMPDDGDPDNPLRAAIRAAARSPLGIYAAAGNAGPDPGSILLPAATPEVWAAGAATMEPFSVWDRSSRGPTIEGLVKPDLVFFGVNVLTASGKADDAFEVKAGTSFSSPVVAGGGALLMEAFQRAGLLSREGRYARIEPEALLPTLALISRKPAGASTGKDDAYGVGQPFGDLAARLLTQPAAASFAEPAAQLLELGVVGAVLAAMFQGLAKGR